MSGRHRTLVLLVLVVAALGALAACTGVEENTIIGVWTGVDESGETGTIEFQEDGTVIINEELTGEYTLLDEDRLELIGPTGAIMFNYEVDGDTLVLSDGMDSMTFERIGR